MSQKNILILGSGGREAALAWKIKQSPNLGKLFIAPGNAGTDAFGENIALDIRDFETVADFCENNSIDYVIPGSEELLVAGIADFLNAYSFSKTVVTVGPHQQAAALEGSKDFAKDLMKKHHIPTAGYETFTKDNYQKGVDYLKNHSLPIVLKADGLAAGKGVVIATTHEEALETFEEMIQEAKFGDASSKVVIEAFLTGIESSAFIFTDGTSYIRLPDAKDYKRIGEGETGLNTGGMGAVSPVPFMAGAYEEKVVQNVIEPTIKALQKENISYQGFIFFGLINVDGEPYVIEYNCRLGDPETEVILPRLEGDIISMFELIGQPTAVWESLAMKISTQHAATVMSVSGGYPGAIEKGKLITIEKHIPQATIFYAGAKKEKDQILTNGGRVLAVTSLADSMEAALTTSYEQLASIKYEGQYYRKDIGFEFK